MNRRRFPIVMTALAVLLLLLIAGCLLIGSVDIPAREVLAILTGGEPSKATWGVIVLHTRVPMICTAILAGAALSVAGLLMQTVFNNPLAGPSILGVSTGASLGVAIVMLSAGFGVAAESIGGYTASLVGAILGAAAVMAALLAFSAVVRSNTMLLIVGILLSYLTSSAISFLNFFATEEGVHSFVIWGLGSFTGLTLDRLPAFALLIVVSLAWAALLVKPLNAMLLGQNYAANLGVNTRSVRNQLLVATGLLTAVVTAFCGPIGFLGLAVPHVARLLLMSSNHNTLLPCTALAGAVVALLCTFISVLPSSGTLPINSITPLVGVPVILYIIVNRRRIPYFN